MKPLAWVQDQRVPSGASLTGKVAITALACMYSFLAHARADLDSDMGGGALRVWMLPILFGFFGAIVCHHNKAIVHEHTALVNLVLKWGFWIAITLMALPIIGNFVGFYFDKNTGTLLLSAWGVGKAAQGLYISGVAVGKQNR